MKAFLDLLRRLLRRPPTVAPATVAAPAPPLRILVAPLAGDHDDIARQHLLDSLAERPDLAATAATGEPLQMEPAPDAARVAPLAIKARQMLAESSADVLLWGEVVAIGDYMLRLLPAATAEDERPGGLSFIEALALPADFDERLATLLHAALLAVAAPQDEAQRRRRNEALAEACAEVEPLRARLPLSMSPGQQASALSWLARIAVETAAVDPESGWLPKAVEGFRAALARLPRDHQTVNEALIHRHLAGVLSQLAEGAEDDVALMLDLVAALRDAAETLPRVSFPVDWGLQQNRLGLALYRLDLKTGDSALLKEALTAFQGALQVFPRTEAPVRWAEIMHNLAQALEVYGDQMRSPEVLQRAVDACRAVLELRDRERQPLAWAAARNTLGSALFLLGKHARTTEHLDEADQALSEAGEVYRALGATRLAAVAEKNRAIVEKLRRVRRERPVAALDWAEDGEAPAS